MFNRLLPYFHHPFWGFVPLFLVQHPYVSTGDFPDLANKTSTSVRGRPSASENKMMLPGNPAARSGRKLKVVNDLGSSPFHNGFPKI